MTRWYEKCTDNSWAKNVFIETVARVSIMKKLRLTKFWGVVGTTWALISVAFFGAAILLSAPFVGAKRAFFGIGKWWIRQQLWLCGGSWSSRGWENLPENIRDGSQPAVFVSNHESFLDPPMLMGAIPVPAVYIAKKEVKRMPFVGWVAWAAGMIFIDRSNPEKAAETIEEAAMQIRQGKNAVIFPEGTRTRDGRIGRFKKGGFSLAMKAGVPIVPLATVGGWDVLPRGALRFRPAAIHVVFGETVFPDRFETKESLISEVERQIREMAEKVERGV